ncbi:hypothetical protein IRB23M11_24040 [Alkalibacterium sp. m-11]
MPVLATTDINTDIGEVIENGKFGYWCESGKQEDFNQLVNNSSFAVEYPGLTLAVIETSYK